MDHLLKNALDDDAVNFVKGFKDEMKIHFDRSRSNLAREVVADMTDTPVQESFKGEVWKKGEEVYVFYDDGVIEYDDGDDISTVKMEKSEKSKKLKGFKRVKPSEAGRDLE